MRRGIVREFKPELTRLAGAAGFAVDDPIFYTQLNKAIEELMNAGDFPGVVDRYAFATYEGMVTLPGDIDRITGISTDGRPVQMQSPWFEFVQHGPGQMDSFAGADMILERGEAATFRDVPNDDNGPYFLRVRGNLDERTAGVRPKIRVLGYDADGQWIRTEDGAVPFDGIDIEINGDAGNKFIETTFAWSRIEAVIKPETKGFVGLWLRSDLTGEFMISSYAPRETTPSYRRYFLPGIAENNEAHSIVARVRKRFVPVKNDTDFLQITNMNALETMMQAMQSRENKDVESYITFRKLAIGLMAEEANSYRGTNTGPAITFGKGFGAAGIPHVQ